MSASDLARLRYAVDTGALASALERAGFGLAGALEARLIAGGRSNLTYEVSDGVTRWALRRPPLGHVLATAHDMGREHTVLSGLRDTAVPVPAPVHFCPDPGVLGAPFLLMEFIDGRVVTDSASAAALAPAEAARCAEQLVELLARLHALDPAAVGLATLGRPDGFMARQIRRWHRQWTDSTAAPDLRLERLVRVLEANLPPTSGAAIVHGDYRLGNVILAADDPGRIAAVIDWEMATLGDPLADLGLLLAYWHPASTAVTAGGHSISANPGFPGPERVVELYAASSGSSIDWASIAFHRVFGFYKLAAIAQTIVARHRKGEAVGDGLHEVQGAVDALLAQALEAAADLPGIRS